MGAPVTLVDPDGQYVGPPSGGGGSASSDNQETLIASIGDVSDPAWDMLTADATVIAILKRIALNTDTA